MWFEQINPLSPDGVHTYDRLVVLNNQNMNLTLTLKNIDYIRTYILTEKFKTTHKNENLRSTISRIM